MALEIFSGQILIRLRSGQALDFARDDGVLWDDFRRVDPGVGMPRAVGAPLHCIGGEFVRLFLNLPTKEGPLPVSHFVHRRMVGERVCTGLRRSSGWCGSSGAKAHVSFKRRCGAFSDAPFQGSGCGNLSQAIGVHGIPGAQVRCTLRQAQGRLWSHAGNSTELDVVIEFNGLAPIGQGQRRPMDGAQFHSRFVGKAGCKFRG